MFIRDGELQGLRTCGEDLSGGTAGKEEESEGGAVGGHCVVLCLRQICWVRGEGWGVAVRGISEDVKLGTTTEGVVLHFDFKHACIAFIGLHGSELGLLSKICP